MKETILQEERPSRTAKWLYTLNHITLKATMSQPYPAVHGLEHSELQSRGQTDRHVSLRRVLFFMLIESELQCMLTLILSIGTVIGRAQ